MDAIIKDSELMGRFLFIWGMMDMPIYKEQSEKSINTINLQPERMTPRIMVIMYADIGGTTNRGIAEMVGLTESRVSIIKNSPLYQHRKVELEEELRKKILDKQSDKIVAGDPVENLIKEACIEAARKKIDLMNTAESEFVQNSAATDILGIGGYKAKSSRTTTVIEVDTKMAERWERVLSGDDDGHNQDEGKHKIRIETSMSE